MLSALSLLHVIGVDAAFESPQDNVSDTHAHHGQRAGHPWGHNSTYVHTMPLITEKI